MPAIETDNLSKTFGPAVVAVDSLDLVVEQGEVFGFLGANGAGKSTTINMLLGFIDPTSGAGRVLGHDIESASTSIRERTGVLPEGYSVFSRLTAREHLRWAIDTKGLDDDSTYLLERVGLTHAADRKAGDYSKGMQQRLALAMALVGDPDLLILDEPSSGLDPTGMQKIRDLIREQAAAGTTVFFSSHLLPEVEAVCDRVGIMNQGSLVAVDTIDNLRDRSQGTVTIELEMDTIPSDFTLESVNGVSQVTIVDTTVKAVCEHTGVKIDVVQYVDDRATIVDIVSEDTSLEELFNRYTGSEDTTPQPTETGGQVLSEEVVQ